MILNLLKQRSVQIVIIVSLYFLAAPYASEQVNSGLYAISLGIKDLLMWMLPLTVGVFIATTLIDFKRYALLFITALVLFEATSNFLSVWYAYSWGQAIIDWLPAAQPIADPIDLSPLFRIPLIRPDFWSAQNGMIAGVVLGCAAGFFRMPRLERIIETLKTGVQWVLINVFSRLLPLFILGFLARSYHTKMLSHASKQYALLLLAIVAIVFLYVGMLFLVGAGGSIKKAIVHAKNLGPAWLMALTSGCSLSTMPWTIAGTAKNLRDPKLAQGIIPATTNVQQIGDCIVMSFLCFMLYAQFFGETIDIATWLEFSIVFVLSRFAVAAILGGSIFVMIPIYETYLHFTPEMIAILLVFNVIVDPIVTSGNVAANGALCRIFETVWIRLKSVAMVLKHP
jgi:Na+/H+-dicarboxylate symporter